MKHWSKEDFLGFSQNTEPVQRRGFLAVFTAIFEKVSLSSCPVSFAPFMLRLMKASVESAGMVEMVEEGA